MQKITLTNEDRGVIFSEFEEETQTFVDNRNEYGRCIGKMYRNGHKCEDVREVTCGVCKARWCERCDPAPSALCHTCHGRGYSTANTQTRVAGHIFEKRNTYGNRNSSKNDTYLQHALVEQLKGTDV